MKNFFLSTILPLIAFTQAFSQGMAVNASNTAPHSSAMLDVSSTTKGILVPRMNSTQRTNLPGPATGLLVYDNTTNSFWYWAGSWREISVGGGGGFSLPYAGIASDPGKVFSIQNSDSSNGAAAVYGRSGLSGLGLTPGINMGVWGDNYRGIGVLGTSNNGVGLYGISMQNHGISGYAVANSYAAVYGTHANNGPGIMGEAQSAGMGIYGKSTGTGSIAGKFETTNASNPLPVIMATTNGTGSGLYVGSTNTGLAGPGIEVLTQGIGDGIAVTTNKGKSAVFAVADAAATSEALKVSNYGDGSAAILNSFKNTSVSPALKVNQSGLGHGIEISIPNITNNSAGIKVSQTGEGNAAIFSTTSAVGSSPTVKINQESFGMGLDIALTNVTSAGAGLNVTNLGEGSAAFFGNTKASATTPSVMVGQASLGRGIDISLTNASNVSAGLNVTSAGQRGITVDAQGTTGIYAVSFANSGIGVEGRNNGNNGIGVRGMTYVNAQNPIGVSGENSTGSTSGIGVRGKAATNDALGIGVYGTNFTNNTDRGAVTGENQASGIGVYGRSLFGYGVLGYSTLGINTTSAAVYGKNIAGGYGVKSTSEGSNATAIYALATPTSGLGAGIVGVSNANGDGVRGIGGGTGKGVVGVADDNASSAGLYGKDNPGATMGKAAFIETTSAINTSATTDIKNVGLGSSVTATQSNASNAQPMLLFSKSGTSDYLVMRDGGAVKKIRFDNTGKGFFNGGTQVGGADMAELFETEDNIAGYEPGDVLVISTQKDRTVVRSDGPYSNLVAGVFATKPGMLMGEDPIDSEVGDKLPMGVVGVIPTKVCNEGGAIQRGDLLVTSSVPGVAMKADPSKLKMGQVLGKALENYNAGAVAKIRVLVNVK